MACSGSDDNSTALARLAAESDVEIVALALDLGQDRELEEVRDRALGAGACRAHVLDVREEFAHGFILPALHAGALQRGHDPMAMSLAQALIGKKLVDIATIEGAGRVAHQYGGRDRARIENSVRALSPNLRVIACGDRVSGATPRANLWGRTVDYDGAEAPSESAYSWTKSPAGAPPAGADVEIAFARGVPTAVNRVPLDLTELIESLSTIAGQHGVGRVPVMHDSAGARRRGQIHEVPAATVLHAAHDALETFVASSELKRVKQQLRRRYTELVAGGFWFTPLREALDAFNAVVQEHVTGTVRIQLLKGEYTVVGIRGPGSGIRGDRGSRGSDPADLPSRIPADPGSPIPDPHVAPAS